MSVAVLGQSSLIRAALVSLLTELGYERVAEAPDLENLRTNAPQNVALMLVHISNENEDIRILMEEITKCFPETKVVFLSSKLDVSLMSDFFSAGASGYLLENLSRDALQQSLTLVLTGEKIFPSELASFIADFAPKQDPQIGDGKLRDLDFSEREFAVLRLLASGYSNKLIAAELAVAESTVKVHLKHILRKTRASNRTQAALWAVRGGIVLAKVRETPRDRPPREPTEDMPATTEEDVAATDEVCET